MPDRIARSPKNSRSARTRPRWTGFTLIEAMLSLAITATAGVALLMGLANTIHTTDDTLQRAIAAGLGQQIMDEIAGCRFAEPGTDPETTPLGPESGELVGLARTALDDIDDYHGLSIQPPADIWNVPLGTDDGAGGVRSNQIQAPEDYFNQWRITVEVQRVLQSDFSTPVAISQASSYRVVYVRVYIDRPGQPSRELAQLTRVFAYVPTL